MTEEKGPETPEGVTEVKSTKSIVPSKYSGRYKNGGDDALAKFIKEQSIVDGNFQFDRFFELCARTESLTRRSSTTATKLLRSDTVRKAALA